MPTKEQIKDSVIKLQAACEEFLREFPHFISCIDFNATTLDARAIRFFNVVPGEIADALKESKEESKT